jgi:glycosyltransferase involved in cell wall biosynthesis
MLDDYALKLVPLHLQQCSLVIATSKRIKRELIAIAPAVDPDRILVKPNAIDSKRFPPAPRAEPRAGQPYVLTCVSRIEPKKGILHLVEAVRLLLDRNLNVSVHVLGGVDDNDSGRNYAQSVETRIRELEVGHAVHLEGRRAGPEIRQFLEKSHLFVAPFVETESGDKDGIPTALLEAMASGLPAVATDAGSITEVIDDGQDGALVPQRDASALSEAIAALLADPERRQRMGGEAAAKVRRCFDVQVCEKAFHERIRMVTRIKGL